MPRRSLIEFVGELSRHGNQPAFAQRRGYRMARWSYREVAETASRLARELECRGVSPGDRVLLWGKNSAEWVVAFFACLLRGAVVVPMDQAAAVEFVRRVACEVNARLLVTSQGHPLLDPALPVLPLETLRESLARHSAAPHSSPELSRDSIAEIIFTSGTTADPKGVVISHGNILANLEPIEEGIRPYLKYERIVHPLRFLNLVPLSHVFGQFLGVFVPPLLGAVVIFEDSLNPSEVIRRIKRERVSMLVAVPRVLESLESKIERDLEAAGATQRFRRNFQAAENERFYRRMWRFREIHRQFGWKFWAVISGGATLRRDTETFWDRLGFAAIQGYGLTETTALVSVNHPLRLGKGSIGQVVPGREIKLDKDGEILVRGENVAAGYWEQGELKPFAEPAGGAGAKAGWFRTGDLAEVDPVGNLYFKGRKKDVIVTSAGMKIYPEDLETALRRQREVRDCVVLGLERGGNAEPCAVLLLKDQRGDPDAIILRANESLAEYQHIRRWFVWSGTDFPRTATGKPRLAEVRAALEAHLACPEEIPAAGGDLEQLIRCVTGGAGSSTPAQRLGPDTRLDADLSLSSLDRVELLSAIEDRYQLDLNESRFTSATTLGELERLLRASAGRRTDFVYARWAQQWPTAWIRLAAYYLLTWPATLLLGYPRTRGREHLRALRGPVLLVSNHVTTIDTGFLLAALPARFRHHLAVAIGGERLMAMRRPPKQLPWWKRATDWLGYASAVVLFNGFPLPKESGFRESFLFAGELADRGYSVLVFPEGRTTEDGNLLPFRTGIGLLVNNLKIPVVPLRIDGLYELRKEGRRFALPGRVRVTLGKPLEFPAAAEPHQIARLLEARIAALAWPASALRDT